MLCRGLPRPVGLYWVLSGPVGLYWALSGFIESFQALSGPVGLYWVLSASTRPCWGLPGPVRLYRALLGFTEPRQVPSGFIESFQLLSGPVGLYRALSGFIKTVTSRPGSCATENKEQFSRNWTLSNCFSLPFTFLAPTPLFLDDIQEKKPNSLTYLVAMNQVFRPEVVRSLIPTRGFKIQMLVIPLQSCKGHNINWLKIKMKLELRMLM